MTSTLHRKFAIVGYPVIGVLVLLLIFDPATVFGVSVSTIIWAAMTSGMGWFFLVAFAYDARWTAAGFAVMAAMFGFQTLSGGGIQNPVAAYAIVGIAVMLLAIGNVRETPSNT